MPSQSPNPRRSFLRPARLLLVASTVAAMVIGIFAGAAAAAPAPVQARSADSFVESIGVNVHLGYSGTPTKTSPRSTTLSRNSASATSATESASAAPDLRPLPGPSAEQGIKLDLLVGDPLQR